MAVFRVERTQNYTVMSNYHLRDRRLSLKAKGLLSLMLSLPEDWDYTLSGLPASAWRGRMPFGPPWWSWSRPDMSSAARPRTKRASSAATSISSGSGPTQRSCRRRGRLRLIRRRKTRRRENRPRPSRRRRSQRK